MIGIILYVLSVFILLVGKEALKKMGKLHIKDEELEILISVGLVFWPIIVIGLILFGIIVVAMNMVMWIIKKASDIIVALVELVVGILN